MNKPLKIKLTGNDMQVIVGAIDYRLEYLEKARIPEEVEERETLRKVVSRILEQSSQAADDHQLPGA